MNDGEIIALLGSSGCGKISTLRMIAGFEAVSHGTIHLAGRRIDTLQPAQRGVAMAFAGYALYPPLTIAENIGFALRGDKSQARTADAQVREVAELLESWSAGRMACRAVSASDQADGVAAVSLDTLLASSDVVTLHARVTEETSGMMNAQRIASMRQGAYLINTARGPLVDYDALAEALRSDHLGGAALDTFAVEPIPPDWALLSLPNVTVTPHIAGASVKTVTIAAAMIAEDVRRFLAGEPPLNPC